MRAPIAWTALTLLTVVLTGTSRGAIDFALEGDPNDEAAQVQPGDEQFQSPLVMLLDTRSTNQLQPLVPSSSAPPMTRNRRVALGGPPQAGGMGGGGFSSGLGPSQLLAALLNKNSDDLGGVNTPKIPTQVSNSGGPSKNQLPGNVIDSLDDDKNGNKDDNGLPNSDAKPTTADLVEAQVTDVPTATTVPEPASVVTWLVLIGVGAVLTLRHRRRA